MTTSTVSDSITVEPAVRTASIIPFPTRSKPAEPTPEERLARALVSLNAALAEQRVAVSAWRDVLGELKTTTAGLQDSLQRYRTNLRTLGNSVSSLHAKARSLEAWADGVTATTE
ncbi:MAG: hypothetical protein ABSC06_03085 [Rhodopila sp.]